MENEFDYYLIGNTGEPNVPLLMNNDNYDVDGTNFIYLNEYAQIEKPVYLDLNPPVPSNPNFNVDYLELPSPVFSIKIYDVLSPLNIKGYQLVPAIIVENKKLFGKKLHENFWIENAYTCLKCFDEEKSIYEIDDFTEGWDNIDKIVINKDILKNTSLNGRLIFRSEESSEYVFYHKTVVDAIMSVNPVNIRFTSIEDWFEGIQFKQNM